ncbi:hypothetical protein CHELA40_11503 [Chelatococcus asaccharovorans]|nr:hypothetical protein CHELA40_11503 [Chelatococcus asaccharovorans]
MNHTPNSKNLHINLRYGESGTDKILSTLVSLSADRRGRTPWPPSGGLPQTARMSSCPESEIRIISGRCRSNFG